MAKKDIELLAFNRGVVSPLLLARMDVPRVALSAETQTNWMPRALGAMSLRPGFKYIGTTLGSAAAKHLPFIFSNTDTAIIEATNLAVRVYVSEAIITRPSVTSAVVNGTFDTDLTSWTDLDEGAAVSQWLTGGYMSLQGTGTSAAIREQNVSLGTSGVEHGLRVVVNRGPVLLRVGSSSGAENYIAETELATGTHSLAFTPTTSMFIRLFSRTEYPVLVDSCTIEAAGAMSITSLWTTALLPKIRFTQSGDVVYVACAGVIPQRIERRGTRSWSVVDHTSNKGPWRVENTSDTTITASALTGLITLTASTPVFQSTHVGALFKLTSYGQSVSQVVSAADTFTNHVLVTGSGAKRALGITVTGTWVGVVTLQRSVGAPGAWTDVITYTTNQSTTLNDDLADQIIYYRVGIKSGGYTSGTATVSLVHASGSITGVARISAYTSATVVTAFVLEDFGATTATTKWAEGAWSGYRGYPSAVTLHEGRLWWVGKDRVWASVSDDFGNHDPNYPGDAGPISRSIGAGPVDSISWMTSSTDLLFGGGGAEYVVRSNAYGEPITPTNFTLKPATRMGSASVDAESLDNSTIFVDRSNTRVMELVLDGTNYAAVDLSLLAPQVLLPSVTDLAVQRRPDTRIHCVRSDGTVAVLVSSKTEDVRAWVLVTTDGLVEEVFTLPGTEEDAVYYVIARTVGGTVRYLEKWAMASECVGGLLNHQADSFVSYDGAPTATLTGLTHLNGKSVVCWADGVDQGTFTVSGGSITPPVSVSKAITGLAYTAQFKSTKLATSGASLINKKRVSHIGVVLTDTHAQGLKYGPDFSTLDNMPPTEAWNAVAATGIWANYNYEHISFNGSYSVDSRLCLQATAPRPCTALACIVELDT